MSGQSSTSAEASAALKSLENRLLDSLWKTHELQLSVENASGSNQQLLSGRVNGLVAGMADMSTLAGALRDVKVPVDLLRYIDDGGSPDAFTAEMLKNCLEENKRSKGKVEAFRSLEKAMLAELQEQFPEDTAAYLGAVEKAKPPPPNGQ